MNIIKTAVILLFWTNALLAATISTDKTEYVKHESIIVNVKELRKTKRCPDDPSLRKNNNDCNWVGLFYAYDDSESQNLIAYQYAPGNVSEYTFTFNGLSDPSEYEARVFFRNNFEEKGFTPFIVKSSETPVNIQTLKETYQSGEDIVVAISGFPGNQNDWLGIFSAYDDSAPVALIKKIETKGLKSGTISLPALSVAGEYEVRAFFNGTFTEEDYYPFTVIPKPQPVTVCNIMQNPEFEENTNSWNTYGKIKRVNQGYQSNKGLSIKNGGLDQMSQALPATAETYQFHGFYKTTASTDGIWAGMVFYDKDYHVLLSKDIYLRDSSSYREFTINATTTSGTKYVEVWIWSSAEENNGKMIVDGLKVSTSACYNFTIASSLPPKGLKANEVPQFVVLGFDDNTVAEGIDWVINLFANKYNKDGSKAKASFYLNTIGLQQYQEDDPANLLAAMQRLKESGNEMGNHTDNHMSHLDTGGGEEAFFNRIRHYDYNGWREHIQNATNDLIQRVGVSADEILGFRTPYLVYNTNSLKVLGDNHFLYDCSIEDGYATEFDGSNFRWPYMLNGGSPGHNESWYGRDDNSEHVEIEPIAGLWELPNSPVMIPKDSECTKYGITPGLWDRLQENLPYLENHKITGLDYNIWSMGKVNKAEFLGILKYNLDLRLQGNHAPFMFGTHSQYYTKQWADTYVPNATVEEMRAAIKEFVEYALSKDFVRLTTGKEIIDWCKAPAPLAK